MQRDIKAIGDGALGGALGTLTMSGVMAAAAKLGLLGTAPPEKISAKFLSVLGQRRRKETQDTVAVLSHLGFGVTVGALFAVIERRLRLPLGAVPHGAIYATLVWVVSYKGWVPALRLMPPPERDRPGRPTAMVTAHLVYGLTLGAVVGRRDGERGSGVRA